MWIIVCEVVVAPDLRLSEEGDDVFDAAILPVNDVEDVGDGVNAKVGSLGHEEKGHVNAGEYAVEDKDGKENSSERIFLALVQLFLFIKLMLTEFCGIINFFGVLFTHNCLFSLSLNQSHIIMCVFCRRIRQSSVFNFGHG